MTTTTAAHPRRRPPLVAILLVPVALAIVLTLFAWPSARLEPRDLPVAVAGPPTATQPIERRLAADPGAFAIHRYADEAAARRAIDHREVYGAFVATPGGLKLLTASAASASVTHALTSAAQGDATPAVAVQDVAAAPAAASALPACVLPMIIAGSLTAALAAAMTSGALRQIGLLVVGAALGGLTATAIVQGWLGVIAGDWVVNAGAFGLTILAIGATVAGLQALLGHVGTAVGALTMILVGNPFSAVGTAPELLPEPTGAIGQLLPPGAGGNLLRSTGLFDGAAAGGHALVLAAWALGGVALLAVAGLRTRRVVAAPALAPA